MTNTSLQGPVSQTMNLGYLGTDIKPEYLIAIKNIFPVDYANSQSDNLQSSSVVIRAPLAEKVGFKMESQWSTIARISAITVEAQAIALASTGRALSSRWLTRKIWMGTTPLDFTLNLQFRAESDPNLEVVQPCVELQRMILPYSGGKTAGNAFLTPPGPSPFKEITEVVDWASDGEITYISIGMLLLIKRAIVKDVVIEYLPGFTKSGLPIAANAAVHFQTYEILTKESLNSNANEGGVYNLNSSSIESRNRDN